jgi:hypothetical protein
LAGFAAVRLGQLGRLRSVCCQNVDQGEQRYWVHVAIDRFTGQVVDK